MIALIGIYIAFVLMIISFFIGATRGDREDG